MVTVNRNPNAPKFGIDGSGPATPLAKSGNPLPSRVRTENHQGSRPPMPDVPRLASRNAPFPSPHHVIDIPADAAARRSSPGASSGIRKPESTHDGTLPLTVNPPASSRTVSFQRKLAATMKTGMSIATPLAAANMVADELGSRILGAVRHVPGSVGSRLKTSMTATGLGIVADAAVTTLVAAAGHAYLDEKFYHEKNKTGDEMIAAKKANSAAFAYIGATGTSMATSLAATALTGGAVTASVVKTTLLAQVIGGAIVYPVVLGAVGATLAYHAKKNGADRAPDSLQAGIEGHVAWLKGKLARTDAAEAPTVAPGDDMV